MHTLSRRHAARAALAGLIALTVAGSCDTPTETAPAGAHQIPALRFAGVDLVYALRRVAAEADLLLVLDEIRPVDLTAEDLRHELVDIDLEGGRVQDALARLQQLVEFDYEIDEGVLLVRSARSLREKTALDQHDLPATRIEADFSGLLQWIRRTRPNTYVHVGQRRGQPVFLKVTLDIAQDSSVIELLTDYARAAGSGLRIRRAGFAVDGEGDQVVATTVGMWRALDRPEPVPRERSSRSIIWALAQIQERADVPICVLDRSALLDGRGSLAFATKVDRGLPLGDALDAIAWRGDAVDADFEWEEQDGLVRVRSRSFSYFITGRDLLNEKLAAGRFEGPLSELGRWINRQRVQPTAQRLVGGEVVADAPRASLEIAQDTTVEDALYAFARETGEGWTLVVRDSASPVSPLQGTWSGAYLARLADWGPQGQRPRD